MIVKGVKISELELRNELTGKENIPFQDSFSNGKLNLEGVIDYFQKVTNQNISLQSLVNIKQCIQSASELEFYASNVGDVYFNTGDKKLYMYQEDGTYAISDPSKTQLYVFLTPLDSEKSDAIYRWDENSKQFIVPSYVDDVIEVYATYDVSPIGQLNNIKLYKDAKHTQAVVGEVGKIYINIEEGQPAYSFRWSGSIWVSVNDGGPLIIGEITGTAYDGGKGAHNREVLDSLPDTFLCNVDAEVRKTADTNMVDYQKYQRKEDGTYEQIAKDYFTLRTATDTEAGLLTAADKKYVDSIPTDIITSKVNQVNPTANDVTLVHSVSRKQDGVHAPAGNLSITINAATSTLAGVMAAKDKEELDRINSANFEVDEITATESVIQIATSKTVVEDGSVEQDTLTIPTSTADKAGVQSAADKKLFDSIPEVHFTESGNIIPAADKVTISHSISRVTDGIYQPAGNLRKDIPAATQELAGVMTAADKVRLDTGVAEDIQAEREAREAADRQLQSNIDAEASTRSQADTALGNRITTESSDREAADTALGGRIDKEIADRGDAIDTVTGKINTEIADRKAAITAEETARTQADKALRTDLNAEVTRAKNAENNITANYQSADSAINTRISTEIADRKQADTELQQAISAETTRATGKEAELSTAISTETSKRQKGDQDNNTRITKVSNQLNGFIATKGQPNGFASLDSKGLIPSSQLPAYVDDVIEVATFDELPEVGEAGKIYVTLDTNLTYRWSGTRYIEISQSLALGETSSTAYAGDKGKYLKDVSDSLPSDIITSINYLPSTNYVNIMGNKKTKGEDGIYIDADQAIVTIGAASSTFAGVMTIADKVKLDGLKTQEGITSDIDSVQSNLTTHITNKQNPHSVTKAQVELGNVDNTSDADKPVSTAVQAELDKKTDSAITDIDFADSTADDAIMTVGLANGIITSEKNVTLPKASSTSAGIITSQESIKLNKILTNGDGTKFLADNGTYITVETEVNTEAVKTTNEIPVAGGPLASLLNSAGITSISSDTNLQDLFMTLFTKELWPGSLTFTEGTSKATISVPSFTLSSTGLVEVGTPITISDTTLSAAVASSTPRKYSGFTYGYSAANDNSKDSDNNTITINGSNVNLLEENYTMTRLVNGESESATPNTDHSAVTLESKVFNAIEGSNTVKVDITGPKATATFASMPVYYACSNLGKTSDKHKTVAKKNATLNSIVPGNTKTLTVTGVYPYFTNKDNITTFAKLPLSTSKLLDITYVAETADNKHAFKLPSKFTVSSITLLNTLSNKYEDYSIDRFTVTTENIEVQGSQVEYKTYTRNDGINGSSSFKITFA